MGVYERKTKDGIVRFYARFYADGELIREVTPARTRREAELYLAKRMVEVAEGRFWDKKEDKRIRFNEWAEEYLEIKHLKGLKSINRVELSIRNLCVFFKNCYMDRISEKEIYQFIRKRRSTKKKTKPHNLLTPATINRDLACLKNMLLEAQKRGFIHSNPMMGISLLTEDNVRNRCLSKAEYHKLLDVAPYHLYGLILCAVETGMRRGEMLGLTWDKVDLKKGFFRLQGMSMKTGYSRKVPISFVLKDFLEYHPRSVNTNHVFHYRGKPMKHFNTSWKRVLREAEIEDFRFHDLRHTFVTWKRRAGVHTDVIMAITGHKTMEMFRRYDTVEEEDLLKAVNSGSTGNNDDKEPSKAKIVSKAQETGGTPTDTWDFPFGTHSCK